MQEGPFNYTNSSWTKPGIWFQFFIAPLPVVVARKIVSLQPVSKNSYRFTIPLIFETISKFARGTKGWPNNAVQ